MTAIRRPRFRFHLKMILLVVAIVALLLVVVMQQLQIRRQQAQINQMSLQIDRHFKAENQLTTIIRELRDRLERHQ